MNSSDTLYGTGPTELDVEGEYTIPEAPEQIYN